MQPVGRCDDRGYSVAYLESAVGNYPSTVATMISYGGDGL